MTLKEPIPWRLHSRARQLNQARLTGGHQCCTAGACVHASIGSGVRPVGWTRCCGPATQAPSAAARVTRTARCSPRRGGTHRREMHPRLLEGATALRRRPPASCGTRLRHACSYTGSQLQGVAKETSHGRRGCAHGGISLRRGPTSSVPAVQRSTQMHALRQCCSGGRSCTAAASVLGLFWWGRQGTQRTAALRGWRSGRCGTPHRSAPSAPRAGGGRSVSAARAGQVAVPVACVQFRCRLPARLVPEN